MLLVYVSLNYKLTAPCHHVLYDHRRYENDNNVNIKRYKFVKKRKEYLLPEFPQPLLPVPSTSVPPAANASKRIFRLSVIFAFSRE